MPSKKTPEYPLRINTIGALIDGGYSLFMYCEEANGWDRCGYSKQLDLEKLAARLGRDHGSMHDDLIPHHLYCLKCQSRNVSLRLHPPTPDQGKAHDHGD